MLSRLEKEAMSRAQRKFTRISKRDFMINFLRRKIKAGNLTLGRISLSITGKAIRNFFAMSPL